MEFKQVKHFYFAKQKIKFKFFEVKITSYVIRQEMGKIFLVRLCISIQLIKSILYFEYNSEK